MAKKGIQTNVQDLIYSVDAGVGLKMMRILLYCILMLLIGLIYTATQFHGFKDAEPMNYAQLGRNLATHKNFVTQNVTPQSVAYLMRNDQRIDPRVLNHPDLYSAPLYPVALSIQMMAADALGQDLYAMTPEGQRPARVFKAERWLVIPVNQTFVMITGLFLYLLARQLFSVQISLSATTVYFISNLVWADSIAGIGMPLVSCFSVGAFYFAVIAQKSWLNNGHAVKWVTLFIVSALFAACAFLTRYGAWVVMPFVFAYIVIYCVKRRGAIIPPILFLTVFTAAVLPWIARNWIECQSLFGLAPYAILEGDGGIATAEALRRDLGATFDLASIAEVIKDKFVTNLLSVSENGVFKGGGIAVAFFLISFLRKSARQEVRVLKVIWLFMLVAMIMVGSLVGPQTLHLCHAFWPFIVLIATASFFSLLNEMELQIQLFNQVIAWLMFVLMIAPLFLTIMPPAPKMPYPTYYYPVTQYVGNMYNENEVIATDMPWAVAWYGNRTSVEIPKDLNQFFQINDYRQNIKGLYFTSFTRDKKFGSELMEGEKDWFNLSMGRRSQDFPLPTGMAPIKGHFMLSDYVRWTPEAKKEN